MFGLKKKKEKAERIAADQAAAPAAPAIQPAEDQALIAVIAAAIAAALGTSANGIVIKSIKRTGRHLPEWGARGRLEQISNRF